MSLLCQKNSYLKEYSEAAVKSILPSKLASNGLSNGASKWVDGYDVVLEDTIFFPEGGGQPYDLGTLDGKPVTNVRRDGDQAILFIPKEDSISPSSGDNPPQPLFEIGHRPQQTIDWKRRFDHMQQHSGQHLITAIALIQFNLPTVSWNLGAESSFIEMDVKDISDAVLADLEDVVNEKIRERVEVKVSYRDAGDLSGVRFHIEVPEDQRGSGQVRVVSIEGVDQNSCCGTHVCNLGDLQAVKLLGTSKGKKGKTQVHFLAGGRVLSYLSGALKRERQLTGALKCPAEELVAMLDKTQKQVKRLQKNCLNSLRDLGKFEAERYLSLPERPHFFALHRKEGDFDFITIFINTVGIEQAIGDRLVLLSVADDSLVNNSGGQILLAGREELVKKAADIAITEFGAKGSVQKGKYRGRISDVSKLAKFEEQIRQHVLL